MCKGCGKNTQKTDDRVWQPEDLYGAEVEDPDAGKELTRAQRVARIPKKVLMALIRLYQQGLSPLLPPTCRYVPSCSQYAIIAIQRYGFIKGGWMATKRVLRCNPWHPGGYDPVP